MRPSSTLEVQQLPGVLIGTDFTSWPEAVRTELEHHAYHANVGSRLLRVDTRARTWTISLQPGERLPFHRHVLDYTWLATSDGTSVQRRDDGTTRRVSYGRGQSQSFGFSRGEYLLHDLENIGTGTLSFITVELLGGANPPLPLEANTPLGEHS